MEDQGMFRTTTFHFPTSQDELLGPVLPSLCLASPKLYQLLLFKSFINEEHRQLRLVKCYIYILFVKCYIYILFVSLFTRIQLADGS